MKILVIINPRAGSAAGAEDDAARALWLAAFHAQGIEADIQAVPPQELDGVIKAALAQSVDAVAAGGGDGTINAVATHLAGTGVPLAVLPLGTFNHFAKDLGIPADFAAAVAVIAQGHTRDVDTGEVNGRLFLNNSSIGAYPQAVKVREREREQRGRRKSIAMLIAVFRIFRYRPWLHVSLRHDDLHYFRRTPFVFVGNNEYGNLMRENKRLRLDGQRLCLFTAKSTGLACLLRLIWAGLRNKLAQSRDFEYQSVSEVTLHLRKRSLNVALDGEVVRMDTPLRYRIRPGALRVYAPEEGPP